MNFPKIKKIDKCITLRLEHLPDPKIYEADEEGRKICHAGAFVRFRVKDLVFGVYMHSPLLEIFPAWSTWEIEMPSDESTNKKSSEQQIQKSENKLMNEIETPNKRFTLRLENLAYPYIWEGDDEEDTITLHPVIYVYFRVSDLDFMIEMPNELQKIFTNWSRWRVEIPTNELINEKSSAQQIQQGENK